MKKTIILSLVLSLTIFLLAACSTHVTPAVPENLPKTKAFTDSTGRTVTVPYEIETIAISGPLSQVYILPLAGDMLVGVSNAYAQDAALYLPSYITEKIEIGQLYGGKGEMDLELCADFTRKQRMGVAGERGRDRRRGKRAPGR